MGSIVGITTALINVSKFISKKYNLFKNKLKNNEYDPYFNVMVFFDDEKEQIEGHICKDDIINENSVFNALINNTTITDNVETEKYIVIKENEKWIIKEKSPQIL